MFLENNLSTLKTQLPHFRPLLPFEILKDVRSSIVAQAKTAFAVLEVVCKRCIKVRIVIGVVVGSDGRRRRLCWVI